MNKQKYNHIIEICENNGKLKKKVDLTIKKNEINLFIYFLILNFLIFSLIDIAYEGNLSNFFIFMYIIISNFISISLINFLKKHTMKFNKKIDKLQKEIFKSFFNKYNLNKNNYKSILKIVSCLENKKIIINKDNKFKFKISEKEFIRLIKFEDKHNQELKNLIKNIKE